MENFILFQVYVAAVFLPGLERFDFLVFHQTKWTGKVGKKFNIY